MLEVVSTLRSPSKADKQQHAGPGFPTSADCGEEDFMVDDCSLLDYIDFSSCCDVVPSFFDAEEDILPDLEVDPTELLAEFEDQATAGSSPASCRAQGHHDCGGGAAETKNPPAPDDEEESSPGGGGGGEEEKGQRKTTKNGGDEVSSAVTTEEDYSAAASGSSSASAEGQSKKKTKTSSSKNSQGNDKKKVKVEWTPELHRRFVQAVEQLGIDKAVPSRILEIMGIQCLTRHNIASHLQKYRSHRKHLMAREAEAATWAQKRQMYAAAAPRTKNDMPAAAGPWVVPPTIGFPPPFGRPLHVWGHPPPAGVEAAAAPMSLPVWPRHLAPPRPWAYWHQLQSNAAARGPTGQGTTTLCVPPPMHPPLPAMLPRFPAHPIPMYRPIIPTPPPPPAHQSSKLASLQQLQLDAHHPSKESIDAAIGDVLLKPWLPLPLGLKPPSLDSVMSELHKQGIPKIPPAATASGGC